MGNSLPHAVSLVKIFFMTHPTREVKAIAKRIKETRGELSRNDFGILIGESGSTIQNYEEGQYNREHTIPVDALIKISKAFHKDLCWLVTGKNSNGK